MVYWFGKNKVFQGKEAYVFDLWSRKPNLSSRTIALFLSISSCQSSIRISEHFVLLCCTTEGDKNFVEIQLVTWLAPFICRSLGEHRVLQDLMIAINKFSN